MKLHHFDSNGKCLLSILQNANNFNPSEYIQNPLATSRQEGHFHDFYFSNNFLLKIALDTSDRKKILQEIEPVAVSKTYNPQRLRNEQR